MKLGIKEYHYKTGSMARTYYYVTLNGRQILGPHFTKREVENTIARLLAGEEVA